VLEPTANQLYDGAVVDSLAGQAVTRLTHAKHDDDSAVGDLRGLVLALLIES